MHQPAVLEARLLGRCLPEARLSRHRRCEPRGPKRARARSVSLEHFEYMVTNCFGSHLAYASYCGAKPSVYGPYATRRAGGFRQRSRDSAQPQAPSGHAQIILRRRAAPPPSSVVLPPAGCAGRRRMGPLRAGGGKQGLAARDAVLFEWSVRARVTRKLKSKTPNRVKHWARMLSQPAYREQHR